MYRKDKYEQRIRRCLSLSSDARIGKSISIISVMLESHGPAGQDIAVTVEDLNQLLWVNSEALQLGPWDLFPPEGVVVFWESAVSGATLQCSAMVRRAT